MKKRQRKKREKRLRLESQRLMRQLMQASYAYVSSQVEDPNSWHAAVGFVRPSQDRTNYQVLSGRGFARISEGDQSRRDSFPSPYLPDGRENPDYRDIALRSYYFE